MLLEATGLVKRFKGLVAMSEVDMEIRQGEILSIIGPNGAGKTTCFNLLTGILKCDQGKIVYRGEEVSGLAPYEIAAKGIIRSFQTTKIFSRVKAVESVMIGRHLKGESGLFASIFRTKEMRREEKVTRQKAVEILEFMGMAEKRHFLCRNLSYGDQRKLAIAVALAGEPSLLLLDEPAIGMNPEEIIVFDFGKKIAEGTPAEIKENRRVIDVYLGEDLS
jgi:branched-chain amino acid transport system ATP-binding protein